MRPALAYEVGGEVLVLPELTTALPDGRTGYFMRTFDDCHTAALATLFQIPYDEMPDLRSEQFDRSAEFASSLGYREEHIPAAMVPPDVDCLGIVMYGANAHSVVCRGREVVFDPDGWRYPDGRLLMPDRTPHYRRIELVTVFTKEGEEPA
jgi:hypothetical protein